MAKPPTDDEPKPEKPRFGRERMRWIIAAFVLFQLVVPLTYYVRSDPYDERFAWRMFSAIRLHGCQTTAQEITGEGPRPIDLSAVIHRAWITTMQRNRRDVIRRFLARRCEEDGVTSVELRNECRTPTGDQLAPQLYQRECATGEVSEPGALSLPGAS